MFAYVFVYSLVVLARSKIVKENEPEENLLNFVRRQYPTFNNSGYYLMAFSISAFSFLRELP